MIWGVKWAWRDCTVYTYSLLTGCTSQQRLPSAPLHQPAQSQSALYSYCDRNPVIRYGGFGIYKRITSFNDDHIQQIFLDQWSLIIFTYIFLSINVLFRDYTYFTCVFCSIKVWLWKSFFVMNIAQLALSAIRVFLFIKLLSSSENWHSKKTEDKEWCLTGPTRQY